MHSRGGQCEAAPAPQGGLAVLDRGLGLTGCVFVMVMMTRMDENRQHHQLLVGKEPDEDKEPEEEGVTAMMAAKVPYRLSPER